MARFEPQVGHCGVELSLHTHIHTVIKVNKGVKQRGAGMVPLLNPCPTYIGGFLLSQLKFLLGIFKSLGVLVQLILSSLQLLLQSYQIVLKLRRVSEPTQCQG